MGKKGGPVLGHSLLKANAKTKKGRRVAQQEGFLHTTDMQDGYDWGRLNLQVFKNLDSIIRVIEIIIVCNRRRHLYRFHEYSRDGWQRV